MPVGARQRLEQEVRPFALVHRDVRLVEGRQVAVLSVSSRTCPKPQLLRCANLRIWRRKDGDHLARLIRIVADGMTGRWPDDHGVAGSRDLRSTVDGDGAFADGDQQDLFDVVGVFGDCFTAGKAINEDGQGIRAAGPVDQMLQRRQPRPAYNNAPVVAAHD
jgi:hypothetical protein